MIPRYRRSSLLSVFIQAVLFCAVLVRPCISFCQPIVDLCGLSNCPWFTPWLLPCAVFQTTITAQRAVELTKNYADTTVSSTLDNGLSLNTAITTLVMTIDSLHGDDNRCTLVATEPCHTLHGAVSAFKQSSLASTVTDLTFSFSYSNVGSANLYTACNLILPNVDIITLSTTASTCPSGDDNFCRATIDCSGCASTCMTAPANTTHLLLNSIAISGASVWALQYSGRLNLQNAVFSKNSGTLIRQVPLLPVTTTTNMVEPGAFAAINSYFMDNVLMLSEAIRIGANSFQCVNCVFRNNTLLASHTAFLYINDGDGDWSNLPNALRTNGVVSFTNCTIQDNHFALGGSFAFLPIATSQLTLDVIIKNTTVQDNAGGAIFAIMPANLSTPATASNIVITMDISASIFERNDATMIAPSNGLNSAIKDGDDPVEPLQSVIYVQGPLNCTNTTSLSIRLYDTLFSESSGYDGGALSTNFLGAVSVLVDHCSFLRNRAGNLGGAISFGCDVDSYDAQWNITLQHSLFDGNSALYMGGALRLVNFLGTLTFDNCTLSGNSAVIGAGGAVALFVRSPFFVPAGVIPFASQFFLKHTLLRNNDALLGGGAIDVAAIQMGVRCNWTDSVFINNTARSSMDPQDLPAQGGAVRLVGALVQLDQLVFQQNRAMQGGALYITAEHLDDQPNTFNDNGELLDSLFEDNLAWDGGSGGSIFLNDRNDFGVFFVSNITCRRSQADLSGGCLSIATMASVMIKYSTFEGNIVGARVVNATSRARNSASDIRKGGHGFKSPRQWSNIGIANRTAFRSAYRGKAFPNRLGDDDGGNGNGDGDDTTERVGGAIEIMGAETTLNTWSFLQHNCFINNSVVDGSGGAVSVALTFMEVDACVFEDGASTNGAALYCAPRCMLTVANCSLTNNRALIKGGAVFGRDSELITIYYGVYLRNFAGDAGGAIYISEPNAIYTQMGNPLRNATFINNTAGSHGGAVYIAAPVYGLSGLTFTGNHAISGGGGGVYLHYPRPNVTNSSFFNDNIAPWGADKGSPVYSLTVRDRDQYLNASQWSGALYPITPPLQIEARDYFDQIVAEDLGTLAVVTATPLSLLRGVTTRLLINGVADFSGMALHVLPSVVPLQFAANFQYEMGILITGTDILLTVKPCPAGTVVAPITNECEFCPAGRFSRGANGTLIADCEPCPPGTYANGVAASACAPCPIGSYAPGNASSACVSCGMANSYSVQTGASVCHHCDIVPGIHCSSGKATLMTGFWWPYRVDEYVDATYRCPAGYCEGSFNSTLQPRCADHRISSSPLCGQCESGYVQYPGNPDCIACRHTNGGMVTLLLIVSWLFVFVVMWLSSGRASRTGELKVLFFFLSSARVILGSSSGWAERLRFLEGSVVVSTVSTCVLAINPYDFSILFMLFPVAALVQLAATAGIATAGVRLGFLPKFVAAGDKFLRTATVLVMFSFSAISTDLFLHLGCVPAGDTEVVLFFPALDCHSEAYRSRQPIIYTLLVIWLVILPGSLLLFLLHLKRIGRLTDARTVHRWGVLYRTYLPQYYWLEFVLLVRRVVIVSLSVLLLRSATARSTALVAAFVGFLLLQVWLRPYAHRAANIWETLALSALALIASLVTGHSVVDDGPYPRSVQALSGLIVGLLGGSLLVAVLYNKLGKSNRFKQCWERCLDRARGIAGPSSSSSVRSLTPALDSTRADKLDDAAGDDDGEPDDEGEKLVSVRRTSSTAQALQQPLLLPWELHDRWAGAPDPDASLLSQGSSSSGISGSIRLLPKDRSKAGGDGLSTVSVEMQLASQRSAVSRADESAV